MGAAKSATLKEFTAIDRYCAQPAALLVLIVNPE